jgi:hypothetical protein
MVSFMMFFKIYSPLQRLFPNERGTPGRKSPSQATHVSHLDGVFLLATIIGTRYMYRDPRFYVSFEGRVVNTKRVCRMRLKTVVACT